MKTNNKAKTKMSIFYIYKILKDYSDYLHPLTQQEIINKIYEMYGLQCGRNAISRNIDDLIEFGMDIVKVPKKGVYLCERDFAPSEISFLVDLVYSSTTISKNNANKIIEKLTSNGSIYDKNRFKNVYKVEDINGINRTNNKQVFYNIDLINEAINKNMQISFTYNAYNAEKMLIPRKDHDYIVNPYFMVNNHGKYYLVANYNKYYDMSHYRIEYITNIKILPTSLKPVTKVFGYESGLNKKDYVNEHIYMFGGKSERVKLKIDDQIILSEVYDWFGNSVEIDKDNNKIIYVNSNEFAIIYWCLQYGEKVELLEPISLRKRLIILLNNIQQKYEK